MKSCAECEHSVLVIRKYGSREGRVCMKDQADYLAVRTKETDTCKDWKER